MRVENQRLSEKERGVDGETMEETVDGETVKDDLQFVGESPKDSGPVKEAVPCDSVLVKESPEEAGSD